MDQLRQVLDGINIVVRRRTDEFHAGCGVAQQRDVFGHLFTGQLTTFAGLGPLRHLDLDLFGRSKVLGGDPKAARSHLLDLRLERVAFLQDDVALDAVLAQA